MLCMPIYTHVYVYVWSFAALAATVDTVVYTCMPYKVAVQAQKPSAICYYIRTYTHCCKRLFYTVEA